MASSKSSGGGKPERPWALQDIRELIDLLVERQITEFEMERGEFRIRIKRGSSQADVPDLASSAVSATPVSYHIAPDVPAPVPDTPSPATEIAPAESAEGLYVIKSPIVGTYYAAPTPNAPTFVKLGDVVEVGQVLCIIEAMKLMNEIEAEIAGEIARIYVENGQPVEYGQSLFAIKPSHRK